MERTAWSFRQMVFRVPGFSGDGACFTIDGKTMHFFEGKVKGYIVEPRGSRNFGWDSIFQPAGQQKTFGEMSPEEKQRLSPRGKAAVKFKQFLKLKVKQK